MIPERGRENCWVQVLNRLAEMGPSTQLRGWRYKEGNCLVYSNGRERKFTATDGTRWVKCGGGKSSPDCFSFLTNTLVTRRSANKSQKKG